MTENHKKTSRWKNKRIHLVITVFNEEKVIKKVVQECYEFIKKFPRGKLIVTEDGSTDNTKIILRKLQKKIPISVYMSNKRKGATNGFRDALKKALPNADLILFSDSDGQHKINDFYKLLPLSDQYDMVIGWKRNRKDNLIRIIGSWVWNHYINLLYGLNLHDINCGFRVINYRLLKEILPQVNLFKECILTELTLRAHLKGFNFKEVAVSHYQRKNENRAWKGKNMLYVGMRLFKNAWKIKYC